MVHFSGIIEKWRNGIHLFIHIQVICDADLIFINIIARWPGSVHDARILRESALFRAFESPRKPLNGVFLGDRGYMLRDWLMTPILHPATQRERNYNFAHSSTRTTVERSIGVAKRRWHCLRTGLRLEPAKACQVITVCLMLHNRATRLRLDPPDSDDEEEEDDDTDEEDEGEHPDHEIDPRERARRNAGHAVRQRLMNEYF
ncbi:putative nuclease HARBI1 [Littorina saxatilis]|uniref:putative nuclease HARBI1 n=1 Tax=Littorina saxatilis TaxID=31220 RepID=UPI0038B69B74